MPPSTVESDKQAVSVMPVDTHSAAVRKQSGNTNTRRRESYAAEIPRSRSPREVRVLQHHALGSQIDPSVPFMRSKKPETAELAEFSEGLFDFCSPLMLH